MSLETFYMKPYLESMTYRTPLTRPDSTKDDQIGAIVPPISRTVALSSGPACPEGVLKKGAFFFIPPLGLFCPADDIIQI